MVVSEDTGCLIEGQNRLEDKYKNPDVLLKVNKANIAGMMEAIKGYLRLYHGVVRAPLVDVITKPY